MRGWYGAWGRSAPGRGASGPRRGAGRACLPLLLGLLAGFAGWTAVGWAQAPVQVVVDAPADGSTTGPELTVWGWAAAGAGSAPGIDAVAVYVDGQDDDRGRFLGAATYGILRADVAVALDDPTRAAVGYELRVTLPPGDHRIAVYARASGVPDGEGWSPPAVVGVRVATSEAAAPSARAPVRAPSPVPPGVTGATACTSRGPNGQCLAYSAANGGIALVCREQNADGECLGYQQSYTVNTACAQYGTGGQCLTYGTSPAVNPPPGGAAQTTALCLERNAVGQCSRYSNAAAPDPSTISLTAQVAGSATTLTWTTFPAAATYEVLRCATPQIANCGTVSQSGSTSYPLTNRQNYWYAVRARGADGQVLATSTFLGPL